MLEIKEHLTTVLKVRVGKPQRSSMEAFIFHRNITKIICLSDECDQFQVISLCSSRSSSSFKLVICTVLVLVLVLVPSCLSQCSYSSFSKLFVCILQVLF